MEQKDKLIVFEDKKIRRIWYDNEWWFVIKDIIEAITDSKDSSQYLKKLRKRDETVNHLFKGGGQIVPPLGLEFETKGGKQIFQCWNTKAIFRLIQSIPSKKAEPFKQWLAQVGYERIEEIENPEIGQDRIKEYYELKGYPKNYTVTHYIRLVV
jgi:DNA-damage-inducible protein D